MCFYFRSFIWILVFIFIAYPVAFIASIFYVFIQPFALCCQFMYNVEDYLFELVSLPMTCMYNIIYSRSFSFNKDPNLTRPNSHQSSLRQVSAQLNTHNSFGNVGSYVIAGNHSTASCLENNNNNLTPSIKLEQTSKKSASINLPDNQINQNSQHNLNNQNNQNNVV